MTHDEAIAAGWVFENDFAEKTVDTPTGVHHLHERNADEEQLLEQIEGREALLAAGKLKS